MLVTGQKYAEDVLKVAGTPTFFVNGDMIVGEAAFGNARLAVPSPVRRRVLARPWLALVIKYCICYGT